MANDNSATVSTLATKRIMGNDADNFDAVIVGAGFAGMYMLHNLVNLGVKVLAIEEASEVGGTWYWNRYPGARCDVESIEYSYSFSEEIQQGWEWTDRYSKQPEILAYANHVADKLSLRPFIKFDTRVVAAKYNESSRVWSITTDEGRIYFARYFIMATGTLSSINQPRFEGLNSYKGNWYITGRWPRTEVDFSGKRVGIIGTGSSAVQAIPVIAKQAKHLTVFQRTPNYSIPAENKPLDPHEVANIKANYSQIRAKAKENRAGIAMMEVGTKRALETSQEEREKEYARRWRAGGTGFTAAYTDIMEKEAANETAAEFVRDQIRRSVHNSVTAEMLSPKNAIGCKRLCADTDYYITYNRDNVTLIDVNKTPIKRLVSTGLKTSERIFHLDAIIFAMGFDAMTGAILAVDIRGKSGELLKDKWIHGPQTYLGLSCNGFPNMFTITGPGSPSVLSNMMTSIEQHVEWITECIKFMTSSGKTEIEANLMAQDEWMDHVEEVANKTLRYSCNSWYVGANIPGKKRVFLPYAGGLPAYSEKCLQVASAHYQGFSVR